MTDFRRDLEHAATLRMLVAVNSARAASRTYRTIAMTDTEPNAAARMIAAELLDRVAIGDDGSPILIPEATSAEDVDAAIEAEARLRTELVVLADVSLVVIEDATDAAVALGVIEDTHAPMVCLRVLLAPSQHRPDDAPVPRMGAYIRIPTGEPGVDLLFRVIATYEDLNAPNPFASEGENWTPTEALDSLRPGEALVVQVLDYSELELP